MATNSYKNSHVAKGNYCLYECSNDKGLKVNPLIWRRMCNRFTKQLQSYVK